MMHQRQWNVTVKQIVIELHMYGLVNYFVDDGCTVYTGNHSYVEIEMAATPSLWAFPTLVGYSLMLEQLQLLVRV